MSRWILKRNKADVEYMARDLGVNPITACVLANMGLNTKRDALDFLYPDIKRLCDESKLADIGKAAKIVYSAIQNSETIAVYGDYDADGVVSSYLLYSWLKDLGANIFYYIPRRERDGYGLNERAADELCERGAKLVLACDNGISAFDEIAYAKSLGMKVVVIDHHEPRYETGENGERRDILPPADAIVDPKRADCEYACKDLCAAALCYKFLVYFHAYYDADFERQDEAVCLAALATVCDIVDITSEARAIVKTGLQIMSAKNVNRGLAALIKNRGLGEKRLDVFDLGFIIGPCLNAAGRLLSAECCVKLFLAETDEEAAAIAGRLAELNDERKSLTAKCVARALDELSGRPLDKVIVYFDGDGRESLSGIVAGRIKDALHHPVIALARSGELVKGSARSIEGYNIFDALCSCSDLFVKFGGHEMAAGLTLEEKNVDALRERLNASCDIDESVFVPLYRIEKELKLSDISFDLARELRRLEPHGRGNPAPLFGTKGLVPDVCEIIGEARTTLRFAFSYNDGRKKIKGICFNRVGDFAALIRDKLSEEDAEAFLAGNLVSPKIMLDIVYRVEINEYNGNEYLQIRIVDFR